MSELLAFSTINWQKTCLLVLSLLVVAYENRDCDLVKAEHVPHTSKDFTFLCLYLSDKFRTFLAVSCENCRKIRKCLGGPINMRSYVTK